MRLFIIKTITWGYVLILGILFAVNASPPEGDNMDNVSFPPETIRKPAVAGSWYPGNKEDLSREISLLLDRAVTTDLPRDPIALVAPHAGYAYSGTTAASAFRQVADRDYESVIVIAPSHHEWFDGVSIWDRGAYMTPLGLIPVDVELAKKIEEAYPAVHFTPKGHGSEHSLEIELPFLQTVIPDMKIVPMVMADRSLETCRNFANAIHQAVGNRKVLIVASSDLYHGNSYKDCVETDNRTLERIQALDAEGLCQGLDRSYMACGGGPITVAIMAAKLMGATEARIIKQTNSNDVIGERGGYVVGYAAIAIY